MLINGEKFACEACIRGHRVSSCHHSDRPLVHVNKKGRPVSQCQHCRGLRKSRSQHVHCECQQKGHSKEECHSGKGDAKQEPGSCCCSHTGKCTCALKKDHLDSVPENIPQVLQPKETHKMRSPNMNSHESKATIFSNGHHKPVHKFNDAHNHCGAPYKIPSKANSIHGHRDIAQRSVDNLPLTNKAAKPHHESPLHSFMTPPKQTRMVKSEHNSPHLGPTLMPPDDLKADFNIPAFDPSAYSYSPFGANTNSAAPNSGQMDLNLPERFPENWFMTYEQAHTYTPAPVDWSQYNFDSTENLLGNMNNNNLQASSQPSSFAPLGQFGHLQNPDLAMSSGDVSETDDYSTNRPSVPRSTSYDVSHGSPAPDDASERYRLSSASSIMGTPHGNMLASDAIGRLDIDDYLRQAEAETRKMQIHNQPLNMQQIQQPATGFGQGSMSQGQRASSASSVVTSPPSMSSAVNSPGRSTGAEHPFTIHEAQQIAHMEEAMSMQPRSKFDIPPASMNEDPMWSQAPDMNPMMNLDDEQEDEDWVR